MKIPYEKLQRREDIEAEMTRLRGLHAATKARMYAGCSPTLCKEKETSNTTKMIYQQQDLTTNRVVLSPNRITDVANATSMTKTTQSCTSKPKRQKKINSNACEKATTRCDRTTHDAANVLGHLLASFLCVEKLFRFFSILNPNEKVKVKREAALLFSRTKESTAVSEDAFFVRVSCPGPTTTTDQIIKSWITKSCNSRSNARAAAPGYFDNLRI